MRKKRRTVEATDAMSSDPEALANEIREIDHQMKEFARSYKRYGGHRGKMGYLVLRKRKLTERLRELHAQTQAG